MTQRRWRIIAAVASRSFFLSQKQRRKCSGNSRSKLNYLLAQLRGKGLQNRLIGFLNNVCL